MSRDAVEVPTAPMTARVVHASLRAVPWWRAAALMVFAAVLPALPLRAQGGALFLLVPFGARAVAVGEAVSADTSLGTEGIWWNAAALARLAKKELAFQHSQTLLANSEMLTFAVPSRMIGTLALSAYMVDYGDQQATDINNSFTGVISNRNYLVSATYATPIGKRAGLGVTYKWIAQRFNGCSGYCGDNPPVSGSTSALDIGAQFVVPIKFPLNAGISVRNLGPKLQTKDQPQADELPQTIQAGVMSRLPIQALTAGGASLDLSADVVKANALIGTNLSLGAALGYRDQYFLRVGYKKQTGEGSGPSIGLGFQRGAFGFDFARRFDAVSSRSEEGPPTYVMLRARF